MSVADRLAAVRGRVADAARASGRAPEAVTLVVVTKDHPAADARAALGAGARDLGENRAQELLEKAAALALPAAAGAVAGAAGAPPAEVPVWHFIGRLQRNKVRALAPHVALWQSVDRPELAGEIGRRAPGAAVLVQVNVAGEPQKGGCPPDGATALVAHAVAAGCRVEGLMTVPPAGADPRPVFARLRALTDELGLATCSMGMSGDYELAIAEGATMVRVGSAIFGPRPGRAGARR